MIGIHHGGFEIFARTSKGCGHFELFLVILGSFSLFELLPGITFVVRALVIIKLVFKAKIDVLINQVLDDWGLALRVKMAWRRGQNLIGIVRSKSIP